MMAHIYDDISDVRMSVCSCHLTSLFNSLISHPLHLSSPPLYIPPSPLFPSPPLSSSLSSPPLLPSCPLPSPLLPFSSPSPPLSLTSPHSERQIEDHETIGGIVATWPKKNYGYFVVREVYGKYKLWTRPSVSPSMAVLCMWAIIRPSYSYTVC